MTDQLTSNQDERAAVTEPSPESSSRHVLTRRRFLAASATTGVGASLALSTACTPPLNPFAPAPPTPHSEHEVAGVQTARLGGFTYFNTFQAEIVDAAAGRIIPTDENGPGAREAGVVYFIDRQLSADYGFNGRRYMQGPFAVGLPTQGDQSRLEMRDRYRLGVQGMEAYAQQLFQTGFAVLTPDQQDRILRDMEAGTPDTFDGTSMQAATTDSAGGGPEGIRQMAAGGRGIGALAFFQLLRAHTIAGFFADPIHGGNRDMIGWKLIGFPGAQMSYQEEISRYGVPFNRPFKTLAEHQGQFDVAA